MSGLIVTLSGVDCSGKSTQIELLASALRKRGLDPKLIWFRPGYSRALDGIRALVRRLAPRALPPTGSSVARERAFSRRGVSRSWIAMALADTLAQYAVKLRALRAAGRIVICDRYLPDALVDLELRFPELEPRDWLATRAVAAACPRPDRAFLLMVPWQEVLRRAEAKAEPFPDSLDVRERRYEQYRRLAETGAFSVIDGAAPAADVHAAILAELEGLACTSAR